MTATAEMSIDSKKRPYEVYTMARTKNWRDAQWLSAAGNLVLMNGLGAFALYGGLVASRLV